MGHVRNYGCSLTIISEVQRDSISELSPPFGLRIFCARHGPAPNPRAPLLRRATNAMIHLASPVNRSQRRLLKNAPALTRKAHAAHLPARAPSLDPMQDLIRSADGALSRVEWPRIIELFANEEVALRILNDPQGRLSWSEHARMPNGGAHVPPWMLVEAALEDAIWMLTRRVYRFSARASAQLAATDIHEVPGKALALLPSPVLLVVLQGRAFQITVRHPHVQICELLGRDARSGAEVTLRMDLELTDLNIASCSDLEVDHHGSPRPQRLLTATTKEVLKHLLYLCGRPHFHIGPSASRGKQAAPVCLYVHEVGEPGDIPTTRFNGATERPAVEGRPEPNGGTGRHNRPHFRRAHFAHRWHGTERDGNRHLEVCWIQPTHVGGGLMPELVISNVGGQSL